MTPPAAGRGLRRPPPHLAGRLYASAMTLLFGPLLVAALFATASLIDVLAFRPALPLRILAGLWLVAGAMAALVSLPFVLLAILVVWFLAAGAARIALWQVLLAATIACGAALWLFEPPAFLNSRERGIAAFVLLPALVSATLCWRLTRHRHSPYPGG